MNFGIMKNCQLSRLLFSKVLSQCFIKERLAICSMHSGKCRHMPKASIQVLKIKQQVSFSTTGTAYAHSMQNQRRGISADSKTTAVTIWEDLKQIRFSPIPALVFGFSGLIPFVVPPAYMILAQTFSSQLLFAQTVYGASILSFLGGVRWGFVIPEESEHRPDWFNLGYSVTPSLIAWTALLIPQPFSVLLIMGGIAGSAFFDTAIKGYPPWFKGLRFTLSLGAVLSLWTVFLCQFVFITPEPSDKKTVLTERDE